MMATTHPQSVRLQAANTEPAPCTPVLCNITQLPLWFCSFLWYPSGFHKLGALLPALFPASCALRSQQSRFPSPRQADGLWLGAILAGWEEAPCSDRNQVENMPSCNYAVVHGTAQRVLQFKMQLQFKSQVKWVNFFKGKQWHTSPGCTMPNSTFLGCNLSPQQSLPHLWGLRQEELMLRTSEGQCGTHCGAQEPRLCAEWQFCNRLRFSTVCVAFCSSVTCAR